MTTYDLHTQVTRQPSDFYPSIYELYNRQFRDSIQFIYHTGITDRYGTAAEAGSTGDDEDDDDLPGIGLEHLQKEINLFIKFVFDLPGEPFSRNPLDITWYANLEANVFLANVILHDKTIVMIRISPTRRRTMTGFTVFSDTRERPGMDKLIEYAKQFIAPPAPKKDRIHIIVQSNNDFYLKDIELKVPSKQTAFSYDHYNEGFQEISERVISTLQANHESGLVLFHGDAGTGKTTFLKHLLHTITNKKLIYMPPDLTQHLSSPGFITFMMSEALNSILLIEDAENVLQHREAGGNQAVSNILNISDGILGDVLKLQIVCTFNSKLDAIDPALLRPGRCIAEYRFEPLAIDRAGNLLADLYGDDIDAPTKPMTLAECFNFKKPKDRSKTTKQKLGFT